MACLDLAMRAKAGKLKRGEAAALPVRARRDLPDDIASIAAADRFAKLAADGFAMRAGVKLHDFVLVLSDRMLGSQNETMARAVSQADERSTARFAWQDRADLK